MTRTHFCGTSFVVAVFAVCLTPPAAAESFLKKVDNREAVESALLAELAATMRPGETQDHILRLEDALRPMYVSVPSEKDGSLSHSVVRYVLHRFFAKRGWYIRGLEPAGIARNASKEELQEWVPAFLQGFLEQLGNGRGINLRELAILCSSLENLIHKEAISRLEQAFNSLHLPFDTKLSEAQITEVMEVYMMIYMLAGKFSAKDPATVRRAHDLFTKKVADWSEVQQWMHSVMEVVHPPLAPGVLPPLDFREAGRVVEAINEQYTTYNTRECGKLKSSLLDIESQKPGRVRLAEFYKKGLTGVFQFNEKIEYLRSLGALDEANPEEPHVIVANYVASRPNCMTTSDFYVMCCRNECEDLMGGIEQEVKAEMATTDQVLKLVENMPTETVEAPRVLSVTLENRLKGIAAANNGSVPLHGRLFAQWMHHAFPRECPYPAQAGTTAPQTADEWIESTGQSEASLSVEQLHTHVAEKAVDLPVGLEARKHHHFDENELPWDHVEELLTPPRTFEEVLGVKHSTQRKAQSVLLTVVAFVVVSGLVVTGRSLLAPEDGPRKGKMDFNDFLGSKMC